jgi:hypothetical protein
MKKTKGPGPLIEAAIAASPVEPPRDKLEALKKLAKDAMVLRTRIKNGEELLADLRAKNNKMLMETLPEFMNDVGVPSLVVEGRGNEPPFSVINAPFYSASLPKPKRAGDPDRRPEGFAYLESIGHGDLIKFRVSFMFDAKTAPELIRKFVDAATALRVSVVKKKGRKTTVLGLGKVPHPDVDKSVNANTLTAWLKRQVEDEEFIPKLDKIGGFVGNKVEIKTVEE